LVRNIPSDRPELECASIHCCWSGTDDELGKEERKSLPERVWRKVQAEEILHATGDLLDGDENNRPLLDILFFLSLEDLPQW